MELCLAIGCTLDELGHRMSGREFDMWVARYHFEPWGGLRGDLHAAIVAAELHNSEGRPVEGGKPRLPSEFLPDFARAAKAAREHAQAQAASDPDPLEHFRKMG